jgi:uncharacterized membrane protein YeaQ/YmgE (transglycosylase-associated protein family)
MLGVLQLAVLAQESGDGNITLGSILLYVLVGAVVGVLARFLVPGEDPLGIVGTIVLGVIGAVIGGWLAGAVFEDTEGVDWIASIVVAVLLVLAVRMFRRTDTRSRTSSRL